MKPAPFQMYRPESLAEALDIIGDNADDARLLAGGQSLVPLLNLRLAMPAILVDLNRVRELAGIRRDGSVLRIGAMTRQQDLLESALVTQTAPLLVKAASYVGHLQTRSRGTIGGTVAQADPSGELPLAFTALDATLTIASRRGVREMPIRSFFRYAMVTALEPGEILTEIAVHIAGPSQRSTFREFARRQADFAIVAAAIVVEQERGAVVLGGIEATPRLCPALSAALRLRSVGTDMIEAAIDSDLSKVEPNSDIHASGDFRRHLARVLLHDSIKDVIMS